MSKKFFGFLAVLAFAWLTAGIPNRVKDQANVFSPNTVALVNDKDLSYRQHKQRPQVYLTSKRGLHLTRPDHIGKNDLVVLVGVSGQKRNVQLFAGTGLQKTLTPARCQNLVVSQEKKLRSKKNATFNAGLQKVIAAACTLLEQHFGYPPDVHSLDKKQLQEMTSPHAVQLSLALAIAFVATAVFLYCRRRKFGQSK